MFEPIDGICWRCHNSIYDNNPNSGTKGYDRQSKTTGWNTSCPHCHVSFVD